MDERTFEREHKVVQSVGVELVGLLIVLLLVLLYRALHDLNRSLLQGEPLFTSLRPVLTSRLWDMVAGAGVWTERLGAAHAQ